MKSSEFCPAGSPNKKSVWKEANPAGHTGALGFSLGPGLLTANLKLPLQLGKQPPDLPHARSQDRLHQETISRSNTAAGRQEALLAETTVCPTSLFPLETTAIQDPSLTVSIEDCQDPDLGIP